MGLRVTAIKYVHEEPKKNILMEMYIAPSQFLMCANAYCEGMDLFKTLAVSVKVGTNLYDQQLVISNQLQMNKWVYMNCSQCDTGATMRYQM